jgi:cellulose synthase/poly-beta-1,6-N-acetylglucosamine synthase-like glycosyltransferase
MIRSPEVAQVSLVVEVVLWFSVTALLVPLAVLVLECLAALLPVRRRAVGSVSPRPPCAVLVPAHDEEAGIAATLTSIQRQLLPHDRLIVVADNCSDRTATVARALGATAIERHDLERRGKGYALDCGIRYLEPDPPAAVICVDADCVTHAGLIDALASGVAAEKRPLQAVYLMVPPAGRHSAKEKISAFAFLVKNLVRPLGLFHLGLPCLLTGTGIGLPWRLAREAKLASPNIVEDMQLGIDLALGGHFPSLCPSALVLSQLPASPEARVRQRVRWEHGHLQTIGRQLPRLLWAGLVRRQPRLWALALELSVPPLSMLSLVWLAAAAASLAWGAHTGRFGPLIALLAGQAALFFALGACWAKLGRPYCPISTLLAAPSYVLWKVPIYLALFYRPQATWVRAGRSKRAPPEHGMSS